MKMPRRSLASLVLGAGILVNAATTQGQARNDGRILLDAVKVRPTNAAQKSCPILCTLRFTPTSYGAVTLQHLGVLWFICLSYTPAPLVERACVLLESIDCLSVRSAWRELRLR